MNPNRLICPISNQKIDNHTSRWNAGLNATLLLLFVATGQPLFLWVVLAELTVKVFVHKERSPMHVAAQGIVRIIRLEAKWVDEAPKTFATRVGLLLAASALVVFYAGVPIVASVLAVVLASLMALHAVLNYCVGCVIYHYAVLPFFKD